jgi:hypothetical protein
MNILLLIEAKILLFIKWSFVSPQLCRLLSLQWLTWFEHGVQSLLSTSFGVMTILESRLYSKLRKSHAFSALVVQS